jgi:hypothetical protein
MLLPPQIKDFPLRLSQHQAQHPILLLQLLIFRLLAVAGRHHTVIDWRIWRYWWISH